MGKRQERITHREPTRNVGGRPILYHVTLSQEERENLLALVQHNNSPAGPSPPGQDRFVRR